MSARPHRVPGRPSADHAEVITLQTSEARVELMRTAYRRHEFPRHAHEYLTFGVVLRGGGPIWCRGTVHHTQPGNVVVIPAGEVHTGGVSRDVEVLSYLAVHVPPELLAGTAADVGLPGRHLPDFGSLILDDPAIAAELRRLDGALRAGGPPGAAVDEAEADDALTSALGLLCRHHALGPRRLHEPSPARESAVVRTARAIIEECYADNAQVSLRGLAARAGVSPHHLVHAFTEAIGLSPHRYLVQVRVRRAAVLLARGVQPSFVAAMTGFVDQSHLTTQFRRYVGTTPAAYQRSVSACHPGDAARGARHPGR